MFAYVCMHACVRVFHYLCSGQHHGVCVYVGVCVCMVESFEMKSADGQSGSRALWSEGMAPPGWSRGANPLEKLKFMIKIELIKHLFEYKTDLKND